MVFIEHLIVAIVVLGATALTASKLLPRRARGAEPPRGSDSPCASGCSGCAKAASCASQFDIEPPRDEGRDKG